MLADEDCGVPCEGSEDGESPEPNRRLARPPKALLLTIFKFSLVVASPPPLFGVRLMFPVTTAKPLPSHEVQRQVPKCLLMYLSLFCRSLGVLRLKGILRAPIQAV